MKEKRFRSEERKRGSCNHACRKPPFWQRPRRKEPPHPRPRPSSKIPCASLSRPTDPAALREDHERRRSMEMEDSDEMEWRGGSGRKKGKKRVVQKRT